MMLIFVSNSTLREAIIQPCAMAEHDKAGLIISSACFSVSSVLYLNKSSAGMYNLATQTARQRLSVVAFSVADSAQRIGCQPH